MDALPSLRQELTLAASPTNADGSPAWTLYDPAAHRFYQLSWPAFEILSRWSLAKPDAIVAAVRNDTTLRIEIDDVLSLAQFLTAHQLTLCDDITATQRFLGVLALRKLSLAQWLLKNYLFVRVPLIRPMPLLRIIAPSLMWAYRPFFWWLTAACAIIGLMLASRHWDEFVHTFQAYGDWRGLLGIAIALSFAKILHEFGHALTAYRYGCHVPTMGIALLVLWPVLYTDTNEAWKLRSRRERLHIGAAGMAAEMALAAYATLLWNVLPDGPLRSGVFMLATSTWVLTLAINASPFTRFDGYFLLSDWLNIANLHERAFALTRWWLRERLFGFADEPPEFYTPPRRRFLIAFSIAAWLYRLVLFLGIALLVYHFFFRALGFLLLLVEIGWFIVLPIARELHIWWQRRGELKWTRQSIRTALVGVITMLAVVLPISRSVSTPAILMHGKAQGVYAPYAAVIRGIALHDGQNVAADELLLSLDSPELDYQLRVATIREATLRLELTQQPFNDELRKQGNALTKRWETAREITEGLRLQKDRLTLRAPFAGQIRDFNPELRQGLSVKGGERLFSLVDRAELKGEAFVEESVIARVRNGMAVDFIGVMAERSIAHCVVNEIDRVTLAVLDAPYVASVYGGSIPSRINARGEILPLQSIFRVRFAACVVPEDSGREMPGTALLHAEAVSYTTRAFRWLAELVRREATQ